MDSTNHHDLMNTTTHPALSHDVTKDSYGPQKSDTAYKVDPRVESDREGKPGVMGTTHHDNHATSTTGGLGSKHTPGTTSGYVPALNAGTQSTTTANELDPTFGSDLTAQTVHGSHGTTFTSQTSTDRHPVGSHKSDTDKQTAGPHKSDMANKLDPRVDSDRDGKAGALGATNKDNHSTTTGALGHKRDPETASSHSSSTSIGQHTSNTSNRLDSSLDADRDTRGVLSSGGVVGSNTHYGVDHPGPHDYNKKESRHSTGNTLGSKNPESKDHGSNTHEPLNPNAGPHNTKVANKLDPKVDFGKDASGTHHGYKHKNYDPIDAQHDPTGTDTIGKVPMVDKNNRSTASHARETPTTRSHLPGPAPKTAGPHKKDILNKLDPRVDSNMDGSKTIGGHK